MIHFAASSFPPLALGFFGLGAGYLIWGPAELFGFPPREPAADRAIGMWGIWLPGFCQFVTGITLFVGLTWFQVFDKPPLYMAALAFSAYGIHWFALGWNRYTNSDLRPNAGMSVAYTVLSVLGMVVFFRIGAWPVGSLFAGLTAVYVTDFMHALRMPGGLKLHGLTHIATGLWLMYLTFGTVLNIASGYHLPAG